jgi:hypothetical protein
MFLPAKNGSAARASRAYRYPPAIFWGNPAFVSLVFVISFDYDQREVADMSHTQGAPASAT